MKINQLKTGVILSYITEAVNILSGLFYTPVMLRLLGINEYGLYQLVHSVVSYLGVLSLGFGAGYMRFYSRFKAQDDQKGIAKLNGMFLIIFSVIAVVCLLCGGVMASNVRMVFGDGLTDAELSKARILLSMMVVNLSATFINSAFKCQVTAHENFVFQRCLGLFKAVFNPFLTLPLLIMGCGSVAMVGVTTFITFFALITDILYCIKKLKVKFYFRQFDFSLLKEMWVFTFFIFINMIVDQLNWSIDKVLLGRMIGTGAVGIYGIAAQINSMYLHFSSTVSTVFIPRVNMMIAQNKDDKTLTDLFTKVGRFQFLILGLIITGYVFFGKEFISLWAGSAYMDAYVIGLFLMIPVTVPLIQNLGIEIQRAKNMHKARSIVYLIIAISNIFVSIPCIRAWGTLGAAIGTAISLIVGNCIFMNYYYHCRIKLNMFYFWVNIFKFLPAVCVSLVGGVLIRTFLPLEKLLFLICGIVIYTLIYAVAMWCFGMNEYEKDLIKKPVKKIGDKICKK